MTVENTQAKQQREPGGGPAYVKFVQHTDPTVREYHG